MEDNRIHLFLSYGHEQKNRRLVEKLFAALDREFVVWIDKRNIQDHEDWRRSIVKGIAGTDMTVGLLSAYSTRERGVCLDELGISVSIPGRKLITVLLEDQRQVSIPSTVTRNQWLDLSQWEQYIDTDGWDAYFDPKMEVLIASVRSRENFAFQGEISRLYKVLKPEPFDSKTLQYINNAASVARPWLADRVNAWMQDPAAGRFLVITGGPGTGKSHFSAMYQHYNPACAAAAFFEHGKVTAGYVKDLVRYLIYTLASVSPDYRYQLLNLFRQEGLIDESDTVREGVCAEYFASHTAESLFDRFLCIPVIGGTNTNTAVLLDGLDEAALGGENPVADLLCSDLFAKLPPHFRIVITTRPEPSLMSLLRKVRPRVIDLNSEGSDDDINRYIGNRLASLPGGARLSDGEISALAERSSRMFLFAELACDAIRDGTASLQEILRMPEGMGGLYTCYFDRLFPDPAEYEKVKPFLRVICAFDTGVLPETFLERVTGTDPEQLNRFYLSMRTFALSRAVDGKACAFLFHKSLYDWLTDRSRSGKYYIDAAAGVRAVALTCGEIMRGADEDSDYELMKIAYRFLNAHGAAEHITPDARFLYMLELAAFSRADAQVFNEAASKAARMAELSGDRALYIKVKTSLISWYYDVTQEEDRACRLLEDICRKYPDVIRGDPEIYTEVEITRIYVLGSAREDREVIWEWADSLIGYIQSCGTDVLPSKGIKLAKAYYHRCLVEYRLKRYDDCIESAEYAADAADMGYKDPRRLKCLIYVMLGAAYRKTGEYDRALEVLQKALDYRLALYGPYTLYTANAYRNLYDVLYARATETGTPFDPRIYDYMEHFRESLLFVVGEKSPRMIHYYYMMGRVYDRNGDREKAVDYARRSLFVASKDHTVQQRDMRELLAKYGCGE